MKLSRLALLSLFALTSSPVRADGVVTVYSADGLHDGDNSWYQSQFAAFTKATGIKVQYVEGGSGAIVERLARSAPIRRLMCWSRCRRLSSAPRKSNCWQPLPRREARTSRR